MAINLPRNNVHAPDSDLATVLANQVQSFEESDFESGSESGTDSDLESEAELTAEEQAFYTASLAIDLGQPVQISAQNVAENVDLYVATRRSVEDSNPFDPAVSTIHAWGAFIDGIVADCLNQLPAITERTEEQLNIELRNSNKRAEPHNVHGNARRRLKFDEPEDDNSDTENNQNGPSLRM